MNKREIATRLLNLIAFNDMLDREIKEMSDGKPTLCDDEDYKQSRNILERSAIGILRDSDKKDAE